MSIQKEYRFELGFLEGWVYSLLRRGSGRWPGRGGALSGYLYIVLADFMVSRFHLQRVWMLMLGLTVAKLQTRDNLYKYFACLRGSSLSRARQTLFHKCEPTINDTGPKRNTCLKSRTPVWLHTCHTTCVPVYSSKNENGKIDRLYHYWTFPNFLGATTRTSPNLTDRNGKFWLAGEVVFHPCSYEASLKSLFARNDMGRSGSYE